MRNVLDLLNIPEENLLIGEEGNSPFTSLDPNINQKLININFIASFDNFFDSGKMDIYFAKLKSGEISPMEIIDIHRSLDNYSLIIFQFQKKFFITTSNVRNEPSTKEICKSKYINTLKISHEEMRFLQDITFENLENVRIKNFYSGISEKLQWSNLIDILGKYPKKVTNPSVIEKGMKKFLELEKEIEEINSVKMLNASTQQNDFEKTIKRRERDLYSYKSLIDFFVD